MHRLFRLTAVVAAVFLLVSGLKLQPVAAQSGNGITGDNSYESPTFGYEVEWGGEWYVLEDATAVSDTGDSLALFNDGYGSRVDISSFFANDRTPKEFLAGYLDFLGGEYADFDSEAQDSADKNAVAALATYSLGESAIDDYIEVREIGDALVVTSVKAGQGLGLIAAIFVIGEIQIEGEPALPSYGSSDDNGSDNGSNNSSNNQDDEETPTPDDEETPVAGGGVDGDTYTAPTYGVYLEFDSDVWTVNDEKAAEDNDGRDLLLLESEDIPARLYLESYDTVTKAGDCIDSASEEAVGDLDAAEPLEDRSGDVIEGSSKGVAYAAYSFENENGDALAAYIECRALPGGAGVFVVSLITFEDSYDDAFDALSPILDSIDLNGGSTSSKSNGGDDNKSSSSGNNVDDNKSSSSNNKGDDNKSGSSTSNSQSAASDEYESPTYGFVVAYDGDTWELTDDSSKGGTDTAVLEGPDNIVLTIIATEAGKGDDAQSCVEDYAADYDQDLVEVTSDDEPIAGEDGFGYYSLMGYVDDNGDSQAVYLECGESPDGDYLVLFVSESSLDDISTVLDEVIPLVEGIEF